MKLKKMMFMMLLIGNCFAGSETGNGGFAHVCRDNGGKIQSARLLDLWEIESIETWRKNDSIDEQINIAVEKIKKISPNVLHLVKVKLEQVRNNYIFTNRPLTKTNDAFPPYDPGKNCDYEQVARYDSALAETGKGGVRINREIYESDHFSNTDRAALMIHEAIYWVDRTSNEIENSSRTRIMVAHLFSDSLIPDAVRLTFGTLIFGEDKRVYALQDSQAIKFNFSIGALDGIQSYSGEPTDE